MVKTYNEEQIKEILPHRDPFLFVEKMEIVEDGVEGIGYKNFTNDDLSASILMLIYKKVLTFEKISDKK